MLPYLHFTIATSHPRIITSFNLILHGRYLNNATGLRDSISPVSERITVNARKYFAFNFAQ